MSNLKKASIIWWDALIADPAKQIEWLKKQYHGELLAGQRIRKIFGEYDLSDLDKLRIEAIANEEDTHAEWIKMLLITRGVTAEALTEHKERYWEKIPLDSIKSSKEAAAIGFHAELMRLDRIAVIRDCPQSPQDMAKTMGAIYQDEIGHVITFKALSTPGIIEATRLDHEDGVNALGLSA